MCMSNYMAPRASRQALNRYYKRVLEEKQEIQTLQIWQGDECLCRLAPAPYSCEDRREVYSLSKTFCSTAIGCAVDEGLLSVEDRIVDLFPDKVPEMVSENLTKMRVRHVLSMNTGHGGCVMSHMYRSDDVAKAFLAQDVPYEPGTHFAYNTGATCLLSAIIQKVTGQSLYDYLNRKILFPIGARDVVWNITGEGVNEGGIGIQVSSDDIAKLGRLYLNRGIWEGKRLLSEAWIEAATAPVSDNSDNGTPDWQAGYGYQIWNNAGDGYRGDGAFGQLMIVLPEKNMMIAVQGIVPNMQTELDLLLELSAHITDADESTEALELPEYGPVATTPYEGDVWYQLDANIFGWTMMHLYTSEDTLMLDFSDGHAIHRMTAGNGVYSYADYTAIWRKPKLGGLMDASRPETIRCASYYTMERNAILLTSRHLVDPHTETIRIEPKGDGVTLTFDYGVNRGLLPDGAKSLCGHRLQ